MQALLRSSRRLYAISEPLNLVGGMPQLIETAMLPSLSEMIHQASVHTATNIRQPSQVGSQAAAVTELFPLLEKAAIEAAVASRLQALALARMETNSKVPSLAAAILMQQNHSHSELAKVAIELEEEEASNNANEWRADSVRRKRKKKMNKHKFRKRRKLNRHRK